jgi:hypothetical protein
VALRRLPKNLLQASTNYGSVDKPLEITTPPRTVYDGVGAWDAPQTTMFEVTFASKIDAEEHSKMFGHFVERAPES